MRKVLDQIERLKPAATETMQVYDALTINNSFTILESFSTMPDESAFDPFIPLILDVM